MISIDLLGFLRDIQDSNERKNQENELFKATKQLIIELIDFINSNMAKSNKQTYSICVCIKTLGGKLMANTGEQSVALLQAGIYTLKTKYKLTDRQIEMILCIIGQSSPKIIDRTYINFENKNGQEVFFCIESERHQELIDRSTLTLSNIHIIPQRLQELQNGEWDNFIRTAIKELG